MLQVVCRTRTGPVLRNVYTFCATHGLPWEVTFMLLRERGGMVSWPHFVHEAESAGMRRDRILSRLSTSISDAWGGEFRDEVMGRLGGAA